MVLKNLTFSIFNFNTDYVFRYFSNDLVRFQSMLDTLNLCTKWNIKSLTCNKLVAMFKNEGESIRKTFPKKTKSDE